MLQSKGPMIDDFYKRGNSKKRVEMNTSLSNNYRTAAQVAKKSTLSKNNSVLFSPDMKPNMATAKYSTNEK